MPTTPSRLPLLLSRLALCLLFGLGVWTIQVFSRTNNLFGVMEQHQKNLHLPSGDGSTITSYVPDFTGVGPVDELLGFLLMFFWPILDGGHPGLSLVSFVFAGQTVATWSVTVVEGLRSGNRWKAISFTAVYGLAAQTMGIGMIGPLYLLVHMMLSPIVTTPTHQTLSPPSIASLSALPASITLGYIIPLVLMTLPAPALIPQTVKIQSHNVWQIFPLTCSLLHFTLSSIWPYSPRATAPTTIHHLRFVYKFALTFAVPAHLAGCTLSLSSYLFPRLFQARVLGQLHPVNVFVPPTTPFALGTQVSTVAQGALWFIQWDYALSGAAYLIWAVACRQSARRYVAALNGEAGERGRERFGIFGFLKAGVRTAVLGPVGAATVYLWERDEFVLGAVGDVASVKKIQ